VDVEARRAASQHVVPDGRAVRIERSGHLIPRDNPEDFLAAVEDLSRDP
jgi:pimeloyl-ACP methyl ester carboxylesterase